MKPPLGYCWGNIFRWTLPCLHSHATFVAETSKRFWTSLKTFCFSNVSSFARAGFSPLRTDFKSYCVVNRTCHELQPPLLTYSRALKRPEKAENHAKKNKMILTRYVYPIILFLTFPLVWTAFLSTNYHFKINNSINKLLFFCLFVFLFEKI